MNGTGGSLNVLNEMAKVSSVSNSVPVMKLIKIHTPKSHEELLHLIEYHYTHECDCGIRSKGTVEDFGKNLYDAQLKFWGEYKFSLEECIRWEYELFVVNSFRGASMEKEAVRVLREVLPSIFTVHEVSNVIDVNFRVDVEIRWCGFVVLGVQVKPESYEFMRSDVQKVNLLLNSKYSVEVRYLFYDDWGVFVNLNEVVSGFL